MERSPPSQLHKPIRQRRAKPPATEDFRAEHGDGGTRFMDTCMRCMRCMRVAPRIPTMPARAPPTGQTSRAPSAKRREALDKAEGGGGYKRYTFVQLYQQNCDLDHMCAVLHGWPHGTVSRHYRCCFASNALFAGPRTASSPILVTPVG